MMLVLRTFIAAGLFNLLSLVTLTLYWWPRGRNIMQRYLDEHVRWAA